MLLGSSWSRDIITGIISSRPVIHHSHLLWRSVTYSNQTQPGGRATDMLRNKYRNCNFKELISFLIFLTQCSLPHFRQKCTPTRHLVYVDHKMYIFRYKYTILYTKHKKNMLVKKCNTCTYNILFTGKWPKKCKKYT